MKVLRKFLDAQAPHFSAGGRFARFGPVFRATDNFLYSGDEATDGAPFVRDVLDLKRIMILVVFALIPAGLMAIYNTGYQTNLAISAGSAPIDDWRLAFLQFLNVPLSPHVLWANVVHGLLYVLPIALVTYAVGGFWEVVFDVVRKKEISESFLVTGALFTLILPPSTPLWQVALGISFGVAIVKMAFGGTGYNIFNPALAGRAFLFFAYPAEMSGDKVWVAVDGVTTATPLAQASVDVAAVTAQNALWWNAFIGLIPGSLGETSALACFLGALLLIVTRVASWRIMIGVTLGTVAMTLLLNAVATPTNPMMSLPFWWHFVLGGWAFGTVFMATEPVTAPHNNTGRWIYGFLIGVLVVLVRVLNPSFPEGMMLAILLMNIFAALIDYFVLQGVIKRRKARYV